METEILLITKQNLRNIAKTLTGLNLQVNQLSKMVKKLRLKIVEKEEKC